MRAPFSITVGLPSIEPCLELSPLIMAVVTFVALLAAVQMYVEATSVVCAVLDDW